MMPNGNSVTDVPCTCGMLEELAAHSMWPVVYDATQQRFSVSFITPDNTKGDLRLWHCFWCGGVLQEVTDPDYYEALAVEQQRLEQVLANCETLGDVRQILGPPDEEHTRCTTIKDITASEPSKYEHFCWWYTQLSEVVTLQVATHSLDAKPSFVFVGK